MCSSMMRWWAAVETIEKIIRVGQKQVDEVEVCYFEGRSISADLKREKIGYATESRSSWLSIRVIDHGMIGASSTNNPEKWSECLNAAIKSAHFASPQSWEGLPAPVVMEGKPLCYDPSLELAASTVSSLLKDLIEGAGRHPSQITSGSAELSESKSILANSNDLWYSRPTTMTSVSLETISGQSTGYEFNQSCSLDYDTSEVGEKASFLASHSEHGRDISSGRYDVVLSPVACAQLLGTVVIPALNGRNVEAGRSRLGSQLGEGIFDPTLSFFDDPENPRGLAGTRWDGEGTPARRVDYVKDGVIHAFAYDLKTAYRYGKKSTGNATRSGPGGAPGIGHHNFRVDGNRRSVCDDQAIYVHDVVGAHTANPMSGDFSVELSNPFIVNGGSFEYPVRKAMLSGNVFDMLKEIGGLGKDDRCLGTSILPSIRLNKQQIIV
jgi:PmbA protein